MTRVVASAARPVLSVAPMMDLTDKHFRFLARQLTSRSLLYSEMITARAVVHGDRDRLLSFSPAEGPVVLQLGGDDPDALAEATVAAEVYGYAEVNLNVGCPSERVSTGNFGACLMASPRVVGECLAAMAAASSLPVSVKHRIGIDDRDSYEHLLSFVDEVDAVSGGVPVAYTVHARKAWLSGLSPKENRTVPPLRYDDVYRLKSDRPWLQVELNGGVVSAEQALAHLDKVDGVMVGRAAYENPVMLAAVDPLLFGEQATVMSRADVVASMRPHLADHLAAGGRVAAVTRHLLNLFRGVPGGRAWRRTISEGSHLPRAGVELLDAALAAVPPDSAHAPLWPAQELAVAASSTAGELAA